MDLIEDEKAISVPEINNPKFIDFLNDSYNKK